MYLHTDLVEEILVGLPLKSILKFKTVSKQWRSILDSRKFAERRMNVQKKLKIMAARNRNRYKYLPRFEGDEDVEMLYLNCDVASRSSLSCDGLLCIPVPGWINVLNPSTGEFLRFSSGLDKGITSRIAFDSIDSWFHGFPGYWTMGYGRDKVTGSYKVVRMLCNGHYTNNRYCEILDVNVGEWRKLNPPPYPMGDRRKPVCVNGSIYWLQYKILALDLHTLNFRDVTTPPSSVFNILTGQLVNLEDRLALALTNCDYGIWTVEIYSMDAQEETRSITYSIGVSARNMCLDGHFWTRPVALSKQGNLFFQDNKNTLFKYYPETDEVRMVERDICVIAPFVENLLPLQALDLTDSVPKFRTYGFQCLYHVPSSPISNFFRRLGNPNILLTIALATLVVFRHGSQFRAAWSRY